MEIPRLLRVALLCAAPVLGLSQTYTLSGYLIDGLTNRPLPGIRLHVYESGPTDARPVGSHGPAAPPVTSESDGHFAFDHLKGGEYVLRAELEREIQTYGESVDPLNRHTFHVGPETAESNVLFRIVPRATIRGRVRDEHGETPMYAGVTVYRRERRGGRIEFSRAGAMGLDARGQYAFADLWPGDYLVCAEPSSVWPYNFVPSEQGDLEYHAGGESRVYTESCYPDPKSPGALLHLSAASQKDVDLVLGSASSVTIRTNVSVALYPAEPARLVPAKAADDYGSAGSGWRIRNVPPGKYILYGLTGDSSDDPGNVVRKLLVVASEPLTLDVVPEKRGRIDVHLRGTDGRAMSGDTATVLFYRVANETTMDPWVLTGLAHTFDPGDYWISIRPKLPYCVTSQTLAGGELTNGRIHVTPGMSAQLDLGLGTNCGTIRVHALSGGSPVPFASFMLLVNGTPEEPGDVITGSMDADGHASILRVSPGRYRLWAWIPNADGYLGPNLAEASGQAVEIVVGAGQLATVSVDPIQSSEVSR